MQDKIKEKFNNVSKNKNSFQKDLKKLSATLVPHNIFKFIFSF